MRVVQGVRVLTDKQIEALSDNGLRLYRRKVLARQGAAHGRLVRETWCCSPPDRRVCSLLEREVREPSPEELEIIRIFDRLAMRCAEETERRRFLADQKAAVVFRVIP